MRTKPKEFSFFTSKDEFLSKLSKRVVYQRHCVNTDFNVHTEDLLFLLFFSLWIYISHCFFFFSCKTVKQLYLHLNVTYLLVSHDVQPQSPKQIFYLHAAETFTEKRSATFLTKYVHIYIYIAWGANKHSSRKI